MNEKIKKLVPALRFSEFEDDWGGKLLREISVDGFSNGVFNDPQKVGSGYRLINVKDMYRGESIDVSSLTKLELDEKEFLKNQAKYGDIFFTRSSLVKEGIAHSNVLLEKVEDITYDGHLIRFNPNQNYYLPEFIALVLRTNTSRRQFVGRGKTGTMTTIGQDDISTVKIFCPSIAEQEKIASFLGSIDTRLTQIRRKHELLQTYKRGVMQKIFSQELRFKDDDGTSFTNWEDKQLNQLLFEHKNRNYDLSFSKEDVLSVSGNVGIVNQIQHLGRSYAGESVANYHIVNIGDIVYTKSPLKNNPYGIIKANKGKAGIVSTLYAVYSCKQGVLADYLDYYFSIDDNVNSYLRPLVHKGAKNDMKINNQRVLIDSITIPSFEEQKKITNFLIAIDQKIEVVYLQIQKIEQFKEGLLRKMFV